MGIEYKLKDIEKKDIGMIENLWGKNKEFHQKKSKNFSYEYTDLDFKERMQSIFYSENIKYKITVVINKIEECIGYSLSVIQKNQGEVCTLFILEKYRRKGIGKFLLNEHLKWMKENSCKSIIVNVLFENKKTIDFYESFGFKKNIINMGIPFDRDN